MAFIAAIACSVKRMALWDAASPLPDCYLRVQVGNGVEPREAARVRRHVEHLQAAIGRQDGGGTGNRAAAVIPEVDSSTSNVEQNNDSFVLLWGSPSEITWDRVFPAPSEVDEDGSGAAKMAGRETVLANRLFVRSALIRKVSPEPFCYSPLAWLG